MVIVMASRKREDAYFDAGQRKCRRQDVLEGNRAAHGCMQMIGNVETNLNSGLKRIWQKTN